MSMEDIKKYVVEHREFEMPNFQEQFSLSYTEANKVLERLEKDGVIRYCNGFTYESVSDSGERNAESVYVPKDELEAFFIRALWECVKSGDASTLLIQRRLSCGYARADHAIEWMEDNDFVSSYPNRKVKMSVEEYYAKFGNPDMAQEQFEDEKRKFYIEERRRALMERQNRMSYDDVDDDFEDYYDIYDEECGDASDEEDDEASDEEDDEKQTRRELLERRREELFARMRQLNNDDNEDDDIESDDEEDEQEDNVVDLRTVLIGCLERCLQDKSDDEIFILDFDGEPKFQLKFVNDGRSLKISDGGKTLEQISQTKRKINKVLKGFDPVKLESEEIVVTIDNPYGTLMALMTLYSAIDAVKKMK